jgi:uncharacterized protein (UPF0261 family)
MKTDLQTNNKATRILRAVGVSLVLTAAAAGPVLAQAADTLGVEPVSTAAITTFKLIAAAAIGFGFFRLMSGRHTVEGLVTLGAGGLGLAKTSAIVTLLGLG